MLGREERLRSAGIGSPPFYLLGGDPQADFQKEFGMTMGDGIEKHKAEFITALRSFMLKRQEAPKDMDRKALHDWNDKHRSSLSDYAKYANKLADSLERSMQKASP